MSITPKDKLKEYFSKGAYPTEGQFADLIDSMRHHGDQVPMTEIEGLASALNRKFDATSGNALKATVLAHTSQIEALEQTNAKLGLRGAYFDDIMALPDDLGGKWCGNGRPRFETYTSTIIFDTTRNRFISMLRITGSKTLEEGSSSDHSGWSSQSIKFAIPDIDEAEALGEIDEDGVIPQQNTIYLCRSNSGAYIAPDNSTLISFADSIVIGETEGTAFDGAKGNALSKALEAVKKTAESATTLSQGVSNDLDAAKEDINNQINNTNTRIQTLESKVLSSIKNDFDVIEFAGVVKNTEGSQSADATSVESTNSDVSVYFNSLTKRFYLSIWSGQAYVIYDRWGDADRFGSYNPDSMYFGRLPHKGRIYYSDNKYYYFDGDDLVQFLDLSGFLVGSQAYVSKWNVTAEGVVDLGKVASSTEAFALAADKSITENVKVRQIRWRTSDDNTDGGQGAGGTIFQERYGNWYISQWMMFEGPNRVCKVRTITTGGNYQVSEWQNMVIPHFLTYDLIQRMVRSVGPHAPGQEATDVPATDLWQLPLADQNYAGLMSSQDKVKLDGIGENVIIPDNFTGKDYRVCDGAFVGSDAFVGNETEIGPYINIYGSKYNYSFGQITLGYDWNGFESITLKEGTQIDHHAIIGPNVMIGLSDLNFNNCSSWGIDYVNVYVGDGVRIGPDSVIGENVQIPAGLNLSNLLNALRDLADIVTSGQGDEFLTDHGL